QNNYWVKISRNNRSVFVRDTAQLSILPSHELIEDAYKDQNPAYIKLQVPKITADINNLSLVPLIPGYLIFIFFGGVYCSVKLCWSSTKQIVLYEWAQFGDDATFTNMIQSPLVFESQSSLLYYINSTKTLQYKGGLSLPWLLGFTNTENAQWLHRYIGNHFSNIFSIEKQIYQDEKEILKTEGWENAQQIIQGLGHKLKQTTSELQNTRNLGSSLFINTELFLTYILNQKCSTCQNENINEKKHNIKVSGLSIKIIITCCRCQVKTFYGNEMAGIEFSNLVAAAGLAGGVNHEEWSTMLCLCGVTCQSEKSQYFQKKEKFFDRIKAATEESANNALCI
ncbi:26260_t:CDS:2, partial [Gigaspora rosea]